MPDPSRNSSSADRLIGELRSLQTNLVSNATDLEHACSKLEYVLLQGSKCGPVGRLTSVHGSPRSVMPPMLAAHQIDEPEVTTPRDGPTAPVRSEFQSLETHQSKKRLSWDSEVGDLTNDSRDSKVGDSPIKKRLSWDSEVGDLTNDMRFSLFSGKSVEEQTRRTVSITSAQSDTAASGDIITFLESWLEKEVMSELQKMDKKLDLLQRYGYGKKALAKIKQQEGLASRVTVAGRKTVAARISSIAGLDSLSSAPTTGSSSCDPDLTSDASYAQSDTALSHWSFSPTARSDSSHWASQGAHVQHWKKIQQTIDQARGRGIWQSMVWRTLENPHSSVVAHAYAIFITLFVIMSVVISLAQTVKDSPFEGPAADVLQSFCEFLYASELICRFVVCPDRRLFFVSIFNWIDLVSALPVIIRWSMDSDDWKDNEHASENWAHALIVCLPLVRLLKLVRRFEKFHLLLSAWALASEALPVLLFMLMLIALFFAVVIYFVEPVSNIGSLPRSLWFIVVTMTTVGYGDVSPETAAGYSVITVLMVISSLYMAIPIGIVGGAFNEVWGNRDRLLLMHRMRDAFVQEGYSAESMVKIVSLFDSDGDGELAIDEFRMMLHSMHVQISDERVLLLHESIDKDGGGTVNVGELINCLFPKAYGEFWREMADSCQSVTESISYSMSERLVLPTVRTNWKSFIGSQREKI